MPAEIEKPNARRQATSVSKATFTPRTPNVVSVDVTAMKAIPSVQFSTDAWLDNLSILSSDPDIDMGFEAIRGRVKSATKAMKHGFAIDAANLHDDLIGIGIAVREASDSVFLGFDHLKPRQPRSRTARSRKAKQVTIREIESLGQNDTVSLKIEPLEGNKWRVVSTVDPRPLNKLGTTDD